MWMVMIGSFTLLAMEEGGFGLNFDILEANLINLALLLGILFYFGRKVITDVLSARRTKIAQAIQEAEQRQQKAANALAEQQKKLTQAQTQAERIRQEAQESAQAAKTKIMAQATQDVERMQETAAQDLTSEQERVITQLKQRVAALAIEQVQSQLSNQLDEEAQQQLIQRSIAQLGGGS